jgi:hypothetical protein
MVKKNKTDTLREIWKDWLWLSPSKPKVAGKAETA